MKVIKYRGRSDRRVFSASDVIAMGGSEASLPISVSRGETVEVTNKVADFLLKDRRSWTEVSSEEDSGEVVSPATVPASGDPDPIGTEGDKTEAAPGDAPTKTEERRSRGQRGQ